MDNYKYSKRALILFFADLMILSIFFEAQIICGGPEWLYIVLMWVPALSANCAVIISMRDHHEKFSIK